MKFLPILLMFLLFALNIPVGFSILISSVVYFVFIVTNMPMDLVIQALVGTCESFTMLAIPFFVTAGIVMSYGGVTESLLDLAEVLTGHMKGGLGQANVLLSTFMGGCSGSSAADCAFESKLLVPQMEKRGYSRGFSGAITVASSVITPIIPPGICLIVYATSTNTSIGDMFLAGYVPGILLCVALMITVRLVAGKKGYGGHRTRASAREILHVLKKSVWALVLPFGIIMGLRLGKFTATECGAITVLYSTLVGVFVYKKLTWKHVPKILVESVLTTATVMLIMAAANVFARYLALEQVPQTFANFLVTNVNNKYVFLILVNILMLITGMFLDSAAAMIVLAPLLLPVALRFQINPIHLGIIMCINDTIGGATPPVGMMLFTCMSVTKMKMSEYIREGWPFLLTLLIILVLVTFIPGISLLLV